MALKRTVQEKELREQRDLRLLQRFLPLLKAQFWPLLLSVFLMLALAGFDLAVPWVTKVAVDRYIVPAPAHNLALEQKNLTVTETTPAITADARLRGALRAGWLLIFLALARFTFSLVQVLIMELAGQRMMHELRLKEIRWAVW